MKLNLRRGNEGEVDSENVIALIKGTDKPDEYLILTAHLDHVGTENGEIFNGADDDGSGSMALLEIGIVEMSRIWCGNNSGSVASNRERNFATSENKDGVSTV